MTAMPEPTIVFDARAPLSVCNREGGSTTQPPPPPYTQTLAASSLPGCDGAGGTGNAAGTVVQFRGTCDGVPCLASVVSLRFLATGDTTAGTSAASPPTSGACSPAAARAICQRLRAHLLAHFATFAGDGLAPLLAVTCRAVASDTGTVGPSAPAVVASALPPKGSEGGLAGDVDRIEVVVATAWLGPEANIKAACALLKGGGKHISTAATGGGGGGRGNNGADAGAAASAAASAVASHHAVHATPAREAAVARAVLEVGCALDGLHQRGSWHGAVSASNVFVVAPKAAAAATEGEQPAAAAPLGLSVVLANWWFPAFSDAAAMRAIGVRADGVAPPCTDDYPPPPEAPSLAVAANKAAATAAEPPVSWPQPSVAAKGASTPGVATTALGSTAGDVWALGILAIDLADGAPPPRWRVTMSTTAPTLRAQAGWGVALRDAVRLALEMEPAARPSCAALRRHAAFAAARRALAEGRAWVIGIAAGGDQSGSDDPACSGGSQASDSGGLGASSEAGGATRPLPNVANAAKGGAGPQSTAPALFVHVRRAVQPPLGNSDDAGGGGVAHASAPHGSTTPQPNSPARPHLGPNLALSLLLPAANAALKRAESSEGAGASDAVGAPAVAAAADRDSEAAGARLRGALLSLGATAALAGNAWTVAVIAQAAQAAPHASVRASAAALVSALRLPPDGVFVCREAAAASASSTSAAASPTGAGAAEAAARQQRNDPVSPGASDAPPSRYTRAEMASYAYAKWEATAAATIDRVSSSVL